MGWNEMRAFRMRKSDMMKDFNSEDEAYECGYEHGYGDAMKEVYGSHGHEIGMRGGGYYSHSGSTGMRDEMMGGHSMGERRGYRIVQDDDEGFGERRRRRADGRFY